MADADFNVENLRIKDLPQLDPAVAKPRRRQQREFVMMSRWQFDQLSKAGQFGAPSAFSATCCF